ncbi:MAG: D-glycero-beta-D-manno-heptose 1-phosphate adenylyltransferase [Acidobacteria bacterium]|nr:D-glycero-beta-D-manno-heptose 1-phosphate adenylyltransferase [Acidobacteriota bacterium]
MAGGGRVVSLEAAAAAAAEARRTGKRVVFTNGCFDLIHAGHLHCLEEARRAGDLLIVGMNGDASVRRLKGPGRPLLPQEERVEVVAGLRAVDLVFLFEADTPLESILAIRPDVLVKGGDWAREEIVGRREVESWGGEVIVVPPRPGLSTTAILERIRKRSPGG